MSRLSIELTPEQHQRLKAMAALQGQSMKDLEQLLTPRIEAADRGELSPRTPQQIFEEVQRDLK